MELEIDKQQHRQSQPNRPKRKKRLCKERDDKKKLKLSQGMGLKLLRWQEKCTLEAIQDRSDNVILTDENNNLKNENFKLKKQLEHMLRLASESHTMLPILNVKQAPAVMPLSLSISEIMGFATSSSIELREMCRLGEPLWNPSTNIWGEMLDVGEHKQRFPSFLMNLNQHHHSEIRIEATRGTASVIMNSGDLVDAFLDADKWTELFPSIVCQAKTLRILASGISSHASGSLRLMYAGLQGLSPLVPTREAHFLRYCKLLDDEGSWIIVDFPADCLHGSRLQQTLPKYRRRPSGCIIRDMPNGFSKVEWVEHAEITVEEPIHQVLDQYVSSGKAFGAQRWLDVLRRQCERVASTSLMRRNISFLGVIESREASKNLMKLAQRMVKQFCEMISFPGQKSLPECSLSLHNTVRWTTAEGPGKPNGALLQAVSTTCLPFPHDRVFDLLKNQRQRSELGAALSNRISFIRLGNALSNRKSFVREVAYIVTNESDQENRISLFRSVNKASKSSQRVELMLQESCCTDSSGSFIVYSMVTVNDIQQVIRGQDPSWIPVLPHGFFIIPDVGTPTSNGNGGADGVSSGCLLTAGVQFHANTAPPVSSREVTPSNALLKGLINAVHQINAALGSNSSSVTNANNNNSAAVC